MSEKIIFVRTESGEDEVRSRTAHLSKDIKRALLMVDGTATVAEIIKRSSPSLRPMLTDMFAELEIGEYIRDSSKPLEIVKRAVVQPVSKTSSVDDELDFTAAYRAPSPEILAAEAAKLKSAAASKASAEVAAKARAVMDERARLSAEVAKLKAQQQAEAAQRKAESEANARAVADEQAKREAEAARVKAEQEAARVKQEAQVRAQAEAEARAREETERRVREAAEAARVKAEQHAAQVKAEVESKARAAAEEKARLEAEVAKLKAQAEAEAKARAVAAEQTKREAEAARVQAEQEAARAKQEAEEQARAAAEEAARIKAEQLAEQEKVEAEARAAAEREAEVARIQAEQEAAIAEAEAEAKARAQAEEEAAAEIRAREEDERRAREAAEADRIKAEQQAKAAAEARAAAEEKAKLEAEVAGFKAQAEAAEQAKREAEAARARAEQEVASAKADAEKQAEKQAKREAEAARVKADQEAVRAQAEREARAVSEARALAEVEAAKLKAQQEADNARRKIEQAANRVKEASERARQVAEARAHEEAERHAAAKRLKAEQEEARAEEARAEEARAEEARAEEARAEEARAEEAREKEVREKEVREKEARVKAEQEAVSQRSAEPAPHHDEIHLAQGDKVESRSNDNLLAAIVRLNARHAAMEDSVFAALDELAQQQEEAEYFESMQSGEYSVPDIPASVSDEKTANASVAERRTTIAAVTFFDVVGYSMESNGKQIELKQQLGKLVSNSLEPLATGERVVLDTGDGVAIGFLQHPTDALESAMHFRNGLMANSYYDYPDLRVRVGIHLGPVSVIKDINGQTNMLGDGINSAQRVMGFAGKNQIYVSRSYFDFVSSLSDEYKNLFRYRGSQRDKHGREFQLYELLDAGATVDDSEDKQDKSNGSAVNLAPFDLSSFDDALGQPKSPKTGRQQTLEQEDEEGRQKADAAEQLLKDIAGLSRGDEVEAPALVQQSAPVIQASSPATRAEVSQTGDKPEKTKSIEQFSEQETRQLAAVQAKAWADAEQRALDIAKKIAENAAWKMAQPPVEVEPVAKLVTKHARRKSIPWAMVAGGAAALLLLALFVVPLLLPIQNYRENMERWLGNKLQQPVHIGKLSGRLLPTPRLVLGEVSVGETKQIQSAQVEVNFTFAALMGAPRSVNTLLLDGVRVNGAGLSQVASWLQHVAQDNHYPVARIVLNKGVLEAQGLLFSDVAGELIFDQTGKLSSARLTNEGRKLELGIQADTENKWKLSLALRDMALPLFPEWVFDDLKASGVLTHGEAHFTDLDARILGGVLTGDVRLNWLSGWFAQGALVGKVIPTQNISGLMNGDMDGSAHFQMSADSLAGLPDSTVLEGLFTVRKGLITGMDIVEVARLRSKENLPGGRTHFDELTGEVSYANGAYRFSQLSMHDSVLRSSGSLTVSGQQLSGNVSAELAMRAGKGAVTLQVGGTTESPTLRAVH